MPISFVHQYSAWYITFRPPSGESAWCFYKNISLLVYRNSNMELYSITKGNYNLDKTKEIFRHENNLRFHVRDKNRKFYEFSINSWNRNTINLRCIRDRSDKCKVKLTLENSKFFIIYAPTLTVFLLLTEKKNLKNTW